MMLALYKLCYQRYFVPYIFSFFLSLFFLNLHHHYIDEALISINWFYFGINPSKTDVHPSFLRKLLKVKVHPYTHIYILAKHLVVSFEVVNRGTTLAGGWGDYVDIHDGNRRVTECRNFFKSHAVVSCLWIFPYCPL